MELINEVPPIKVEGRIVACEGGLSLSLILLLKHVSLAPANFLVADSNPALGHPIEFICLDLDKPAICKYCGLRYVQDHGHHHH